MDTSQLMSRFYSQFFQASLESPSTKRQEIFLKFCNHLIESSNITTEIVLLSLLFAFRIGASPGCVVSSTVNFIHQGVILSPRFIITIAVILAQKVMDDVKYGNSCWAKISSVEVEELNKAERACLTALEYRLNVSFEVFSNWTQIITTIPSLIVSDLDSCRQESGNAQLEKNIIKTRQSNPLKNQQIYFEDSSLKRRSSRTSSINRNESRKLAL
ncbi:hypothetical protein HK096_001856, partial [Nowakowskiella sp. JEL0078]